MLFSNVSLPGHNHLYLTVIEQLVSNIFDGYDCINFYADADRRDLYETESIAVVQRLHTLNLTIIALSSLAYSNQYCGYALLGKGEENLRVLNDVVFHQIARILFVQLCCDDVAFPKVL